MSIEMMIYLIGLLDGVCTFLAITSLALGVGAFVALIQGARPWIARCLIALALTSMALVMVPSSKTATMMMAASLGKDVLASDTGQRLKKVLDSKLDQLVADIEKKAD